MNKLASERELSESCCYIHIYFRVTLASMYLTLVFYTSRDACQFSFVRFAKILERGRVRSREAPPHSSRVQDFSRYAGSFGARDPLARLEKKLKQHGRYKIFRLNPEQEVLHVRGRIWNSKDSN